MFYGKRSILTNPLKIFKEPKKKISPLHIPQKHSAQTNSSTLLSFNIRNPKIKMPPRKSTRLAFIGPKSKETKASPISIQEESSDSETDPQTITSQGQSRERRTKFEEEKGNDDPTMQKTQDEHEERQGSEANSEPNAEIEDIPEGKDESQKEVSKGKAETKEVTKKVSKENIKKRRRKRKSQRKLRKKPRRSRKGNEKQRCLRLQ